MTNQLSMQFPYFTHTQLSPPDRPWKGDTNIMDMRVTGITTVTSNGS